MGRPQAAGADHGAALRMVALATVVHTLRSRRLYQRVLNVVIALGRCDGSGRRTRPAPRRGWRPGTNGRSGAWSVRLSTRAG
jgi:hypothetical protein